MAEWVDKAAKLGKESASIARGLSSKDKDDVYHAASVMALSQGDWRNIKVTNGVPSFGDGGTVPGSIGSPQLIMAHGGETVLPTHKNGYGGVSISMTNYISWRL